MKKGKVVFLVVSGFIILLIDQVFKHVAIRYLRGGFFNWEIFDVGLYKNEGIAFGIMIPYFLYYILVVLVVYIFYRRYKEQLINGDILIMYAVMLISVGALSNIIDRLVWGYVVDYIHFFNISAFNLADVSIVAGVALLIWRELKGGKKELKK